MPRNLSSACESASRQRASMWFVGSSRASTAGFCQSAHATWIFLRSPKLKESKRQGMSSSIPRFSRKRWASREKSQEKSSSMSGDVEASCGQYTAVRHGNAEPASGASRPHAMRASVLLPQPLSPTMPHQPFANVADTPSSAGAGEPG